MLPFLHDDGEMRNQWLTRINVPALFQSASSFFVHACYR
jgi:hypothetical protein